MATDHPRADGASRPAGSLRLARRAVDVVRTAPWINRRQLRRGACLMVAFTAVALVATSHLLAGDFINFYAGARAAAGGNAALVYDHGWLRALEEQIGWFRAFETHAAGTAAVRLYSYPPTMLLLSLPLAFFSFATALVLWTVLGMGACFDVLRRVVGSGDAAFTIVAVPAALYTLFQGQCTYFTTALIGGALILLERRPLAAGICIGLLVCKPQVAILFPVALAASGRWRAFAAAAATVAALGAASVAGFGWTSWIGFIHQMGVERQFLAVDSGVPNRMMTVFAALRSVDAPIPLCDAAQAASAIVAAIVLAAIWRSPAPADIRYAAVPVATFLATPYAWMHDAMILVLAAAWLGRAGLSTGFRPWERLAVLALLILPLPTVLVFALTHVQLGPLALWLILLLLLRRTTVAAVGVDRHAAVPPPSAVA